MRTSKHENAGTFSVQRGKKYRSQRGSVSLSQIGMFSSCVILLIALELERHLGRCREPCKTPGGQLCRRNHAKLRKSEVRLRDARSFDIPVEPIAHEHKSNADE